MSTAFEGRDKGSIVTPWTDQATALGGIRFRVCRTAAVFRGNFVLRTTWRIWFGALMPR